MGSRRISREAALQFLYQDDFSPGADVSPAGLVERYEQFCVIYQVNKKSRAYALELIQGVVEKLQVLDELVEKGADNWRMSRLAVTDRNLLRIAVYEMKFCAAVPDQVAINESLEIAKRFCSDDSPKFINGVLDAVKRLGSETNELKKSR